jgi:hypothetical protein
MATTGIIETSKTTKKIAKFSQEKIIKIKIKSKDELKVKIENFFK